MAYFPRSVYAFSRWICWVSIVALIAMMLLTTSDVTLRYFGYPIKGTYEVVTFLFAAVVAFPIAYTQVLRGHIAIEFLVSRFPERVQAVLESIAHFLGLGVFCLLTWQVGLLGAKFWSIGQVSETLKFSYFPFVWGVAFGCAMMSVVLLIDLSKSVARLLRK